MQLFLNSYGAYLGVRQGMFHLRLRTAADQYFAVREVKVILLSQGVSMSTNAMRLTIENGIPVVLLDRLDHPIGQIWSGQFGSISTIRKQQALWCTDIQAVIWIRWILGSKLQSQLDLLETATQGTPYDLNNLVQIIEQSRQKFQDWRYQEEDLTTIAATFRGWEGAASRAYFRALAQLLPPAFHFPRRSRRPALDPFNALLNYLYGFLYAQVELSQMKAGLDPYSGVLHADEHQRPTLVFDMIELYRTWAESVALELCRSGQLSYRDFQAESPQQGFRLQTSGKAVVVAAMMTFLSERVPLNNRRFARKVKFDLDAQALARQLKTFRPLHRLI